MTAKTFAQLISTITGCSLSKAKLLENRGLIGLQRVTQDQLIRYGLTELQACKLISARALGERFSAIRKEKIEHPETIGSMFRDLIGSESVEHLVVAVLDHGNNLLGVKTIAIGTASECFVSARNILKAVLDLDGTRFILGHNHPAGSLAASPEDVRSTKNTIAASTILDVEMLDHIIVTREGWISMREGTSLWDTK